MCNWGFSDPACGLFLFFNLFSYYESRIVLFYSGKELNIATFFYVWLLVEYTDNVLYCRRDLEEASKQWKLKYLAFLIVAGSIQSTG